MTVRSARAVLPPRPMTLPRSSGCTRTSSTRPRRSPRLATWTSSGCSTIPLTRCSRASSSTSVSAPGLGGSLRGLGFLHRGGGLGRVGLGLGRVSLGLGRVSLGVGHLGLGVGLLGLAAAAPALVATLVGRVRAGLVCAGLVCAGLVCAGLVCAGPVRAGPVRVGLLGLAAALGRGLAAAGTGADRLGEALVPGLLRRGRTQRSLRAGLAAEPLPVAGDLQDAAHRLGWLRANSEPVLGPLGLHVNVRRLGLRVVLTDLLDRPAIPLGAGVGDDDAVVRRTDLAHALELDLDSHGCGLLPDNVGTVGGSRRAG